MTERPFISPAQAERIKLLRRRAGLTNQLLQDPPAVIQVMRRDDTGAVVPVGDPTQLITLAIDPALTTAIPSDNGRIDITHGGRGSSFTPFDIQVDDRFWWQGYLCTVASVEPERTGRVRFRFMMKEIKV